jgi:hypothetical protein
MLVRVVWTPRSACPAQAAEPALLAAAAQTPFYAGRDPALAPPVPVAEYRRRHAEFRNRRAPAPALAPFRYPVPCVPRTAVLAGGFRAHPPARVFAPGWTEQARAFAPQAIAAPLATVRLLARRAAAGRLAVPSLTHAVIAFVSAGAEPVADADRDLVWRVFGVPLFEQWLGFERELLAWECAAHEGLHLTANVRADLAGGELALSCLRNLRYPVVRLATGLAAELRDGACPCGLAGPRLLAAAPLGRPRAAAAAAH